MAEPLTEDEARARLRLIQIKKEKLALQSAAAPVSDAPSVNVEGEGLDLQDVRGFGGALLKGQLMGFGDELVGAVRSGADALFSSGYDFGDDVSMEGQSLPESYKMYRDDARASDEEFERENAGTALAANLVGGIASPINKIAPGFGNATARGMAGRGILEGALAGWGESEEGNVGRSIATGAGFGGGMGGLLGVGKNIFGRNANIDDMGGTSLLRGANRFVRRKLGQEVADAPTFKPLNLAADDETLLGRGYRNTFGRSSGGGKLRKQETPWLADAAEEVEAERTALNARKLDMDEAARLEKLDLDYSAGQERQGLAENVRQERLNMDTHVDALEAAELKPKTNVPKLPKAAKAAGIDARTAEPTVRYRREGAETAIPVRERAGWFEGTDLDGDFSPLEVDDVIADFWQSDDAFRMVKETEFDLDDLELRGYLKEVMETPESRSQLGEVVTAAKKRARAEGFDMKIEDVVGEETVMRNMTDDEMLEWAFEGSIDGGVLMELRNIYARGANSASGMSSGAQRKVASAFDKYIVRNIDDADEYFEHIEAYPINLAHGKAVNTKGAYRQDGRYTIDEHQGAGKTMARRGKDKVGKRSRKRPLAASARAGWDELDAMEPPPSALPDATAANAARQANEAADASNTALKGETKRLRRTLKSQLADRTGQRSGDIKTRTAEAAEELTNRAKRGKAELNEEAVTGPLGQASARARELAAKSTPKGASGLSERLTDVMIGSAITPKDTSFLGKLGSGIMGATQGTTQVVQKNLAGQGDLQKGVQAMARALRATPEFLGMTREEQILEMIARGMSRQAALQAVGD